MKVTEAVGTYPVNLRTAAFILGVSREQLREKMKAAGNDRPIDKTPCGREILSKKVKVRNSWIRTWLVSGPDIEAYVAQVCRRMEAADRDRRNMKKEA